MVNVSVAFAAASILIPRSESICPRVTPKFITFSASISRSLSVALILVVNDSRAVAPADSCERRSESITSSLDSSEVTSEDRIESP